MLTRWSTLTLEKILGWEVILWRQVCPQLALYWPECRNSQFSFDVAVCLPGNGKLSFRNIPAAHVHPMPQCFRPLCVAGVTSVQKAKPRTLSRVQAKASWLNTCLCLAWQKSEETFIMLNTPFVSPLGAPCYCVSSSLFFWNVLLAKDHILDSDFLQSLISCLLVIDARTDCSIKSTSLSLSFFFFILQRWPNHLDVSSWPFHIM